MSKRKPIPKMTPVSPAPIEDLLDPTARKAAAPLPKTAEIPTSKPKKQKSRKTEKQNAVVDKPVSKSKCTYYIPTSLAERIDLAHAQARIYTRSSKYRASKSEFIEAALSYALDHFDAAGKESEITDLLAGLVADRPE